MWTMQNWGRWLLARLTDTRAANKSLKLEHILTKWFQQYSKYTVSFMLLNTNSSAANRFQQHCLLLSVSTWRSAHIRWVMRLAPEFLCDSEISWHGSDARQICWANLKALKNSPGLSQPQLNTSSPLAGGCVDWQKWSTNMLYCRHNLLYTECPDAWPTSIQHPPGHAAVQYYSILKTQLPPVPQQNNIKYKYYFITFIIIHFASSGSNFYYWLCWCLAVLIWMCRGSIVKERD